MLFTLDNIKIECINSKFLALKCDSKTTTSPINVFLVTFSKKAVISRPTYLKKVFLIHKCRKV
jgi:hypothetical protein